MKWFKHDSNASIDAKLQDILLDYGATGYGLYWYCVELMTFNANKNQSKYYLDHSFRVIASKLLLDTDYVVEIINRLVEFEIFKQDKSGIFLENEILLIDNRPTSDVWRNLRNLIFKRDNYTCKYCGARGAKLECDHVIPVSKGGSSEVENLVTACFTCNRSKRNKLLKDWLGGIYV